MPFTIGGDRIPPEKKESKTPFSVRREKRKGHVVTVISGVPEEELRRTVKELRQGCLCGGTVRDRVIELQGDMAEKALLILKGKSFVK